MLRAVTISQAPRAKPPTAITAINEASGIFRGIEGESVVNANAPSSPIGQTTNKIAACDNLRIWLGFMPRFYHGPTQPKDFRAIHR